MKRKNHRPLHQPDRGRPSSPERRSRLAIGEWWRSPWLLGLLLVAGIIFAYRPAWNGGFIWDDDVYVTANPLLVAPDGLKRIWFSLDAPSQYFPLTYTMFRLEHGLWGFQPAGYHWVNLLLHATNALLVWRLLKRMAIAGAWLGAAIFALHPMQVESVAWITEQKNVLMCFFFLLTLLSWLEFIEAKPGPSWRWYALALVFYALALFAKTTACTMPAALLLVLWLKRKPVDAGRWLQVAPFLAMGVAMGLLTIWWERYHQGTQGNLFSPGPVERILVAGHAFWFYLGKLFWPINLTFSYPKWHVDVSSPFAYVWPAALVGLAIVVYLIRGRMGRGLEVALLFFAATLAPVLGLVMLYTFRYTYVADHYQYVACIGIVTLVAAALARAFKDRPIIGSLGCTILLLTLAALTWKQSRMYTSQETLWRTTIRKNPGSSMAYENLGHVLFLQNRLDEAIEDYRKALAIEPRFPEAENDLGLTLLQKGQRDEAIAHCQKALDLEPDFANAHNNLGLAFLQTGRIDEAIVHFRKALESKPVFPEADYNLGLALAKTGKTAEAIDHYQKAVKARPDSAEAFNNLGNALTGEGRGSEAIAVYQKALAINPNSPEIYNNLGLALFQAGRVTEAIPIYQKALAMNPDYAEASYNLGNAFLSQGRTADAIHFYQSALKSSPDFGQAHYNLGNVLLQTGQVADAVAHYEEALKTMPHSVEIENNLAYVLATCPDPAYRDGPRAVELAESADQLSGDDNPVILGTLASAYAETARFSEAVATARRAVKLAADQHNTVLASALQSRLDDYQKGLPFRDHSLTNAAAPIR